MDAIICEICASTEDTTENPIILCDGEHETDRVGFHAYCLNLDYVPSGDWLCPECVKKGMGIVEAVVGKRNKKGKVQYEIKWQGDSITTWEYYASLPKGGKPLITEFNKSTKK